MGRETRIRLRAQAPLGHRREPQDPGLRLRGEDHGCPFHSLPGLGRQARAGPVQLHAGFAHHPAHLHGGAHALHGQQGEHDRHGSASQVRAGPVQDPGDGLLPHPHGRGARHQHPPRRDPERKGSPDLLRGLLALLPQRGGLLRQGHPRPHPPAPVQQGGAREVHRPRDLLRRAREAHPGRRGHSQDPGPALPHGEPLHGRSGLLLGQDLRPRGVAARPERLPRDLLVQQLRRLPGPPGLHPLQKGRLRQGGVRPHPQRIGPCRGSDGGRHPRELPAEGRQRRHSRAPAALHERD
ncbi:MAG: hypothetical protein A4E67_01850 [Syntrophaceae bacterium PtaB.Bin038]|nr:MAG: hypothetical protein A4E67_01850 [Syntrophaceae bacterium PtaB.Bin038]